MHQELTIRLQELEKHKAPLAKHGLFTPLNWYKNSVLGLSKADDARKHSELSAESLPLQFTGLNSARLSEIPEERVRITVPTFYGAALYDYVCIASFGKDDIVKNCSNATIKDYATDHWVQLAAPEQLNYDLGEWLLAYLPTNCR